MSLTLSTCFVMSCDLEQSLGFYRDLLGLELRNDIERGEYRWITLGAASQPEVSIVLTNYMSGSTEDAETLAGLLARGELAGVHFRSDDLDAIFAKAGEAGVEIVQELTEQPWGTRDFALRDPSGNVVRIDQPPATSRLRNQT